MKKDVKIEVKLDEDNGGEMMPKCAHEDEWMRNQLSVCVIENAK